jgi:SAM-dependent methyltransferase
MFPSYSMPSLVDTSRLKPVTLTRSDLWGPGVAVWANCYRVAFLALVKGRVREGLRLMLASVGYWRFWPNALIAHLLRSGAQRVLDVSSPKVLSLYLGARGKPIVATDLDDSKIFSRWQTLARLSGVKDYTVEYQDARKLSYPDNSFDAVYSISVIEHIPGKGDTEALEDFGRVVRPGGLVVVEVPYRHQGKDHFFEYDSKGAPLASPQFYERHYDAGSLAARLFNPAGLQLIGKVFQGESLPVDPWIATRRLPRLFRTCILPFEPLLAAFNMWLRPEPAGPRPLAAILIFQKR